MEEISKKVIHGIFLVETTQLSGVISMWLTQSWHGNPVGSSFSSASFENLGTWSWISIFLRPREDQAARLSRSRLRPVWNTPLLRTIHMCSWYNWIANVVAAILWINKNRQFKLQLLPTEINAGCPTAGDRFRIPFFVGTGGTNHKEWKSRDL